MRLRLRTGRDGALLLPLRVVPRASRNEITGVVEGALRVRLTAAPVEGKANAALLRFLAKELALPRAALALTAGRSGRTKELRVEGLDAATLRRRLGVE